MAFFDRFTKQTQPEPPKVNIGKDILETINMRNIELPQPKEQKGYDWVLYGQHNQFPIDLLEYRNSSSLHDSIIESKNKIIESNQLIILEKDKIIDINEQEKKLLKKQLRNQKIGKWIAIVSGIFLSGVMLAI
jgi:hypothetical protein